MLISMNVSFNMTWMNIRNKIQVRDSLSQSANDEIKTRERLFWWHQLIQIAKCGDELRKVRYWAENVRKKNQGYGFCQMGIQIFLCLTNSLLLFYPFFIQELQTLPYPFFPSLMINRTCFAGSNMLG